VAAIIMITLFTSRGGNYSPSDECNTEEVRKQEASCAGNIHGSLHHLCSYSDATPMSVQMDSTQLLYLNVQ